MINQWLGLSLELRYLIVAALGLVGGALANLIVYRCAYFNPREISPWGPPPSGGPPRSWIDRIPVVGWLSLRRESAIHGRGFWVRPLLIEVGTSAALVWLYHFETQAGGLLPTALQFPRFLQFYEPVATQIFFAHALLVILMVAATFIDFDERTIPDAITVPGTLLALAIAAVSIEVFMPTAITAPNALLPNPKPTTFDSPWFAGDPKWNSRLGLTMGLAIWSVWCFALADRRWSNALLRRRGFRRAVGHFVNGLFHYGSWKWLAAMWLIGAIGTIWVWNMGGDHWVGLFTALVGLAVGGGVIWAIRIVASWAMQVEAMGFGDVTLMAMIGAFVGWQAAVIAFFLSPFAAIVIVLTRYIVTRDPYTPFGPYLCAGTLLAIVYWTEVYNLWLAPNLLLMGPMLLWLCLAMLGLMGVMLFVWRMLKSAFLQ